MHHIYVMTNNITNRKYVGQTFDRRVQWRFKDHMKMCRIHKSNNSMMQADYDRYGEDSFTIKEVIVCTEELAHPLEYALMEAIGTKDATFGYNYLDTYRCKDASNKVNVSNFVNVEELI